MPDWAYKLVIGRRTISDIKTLKSKLSMPLLYLKRTRDGVIPILWYGGIIIQSVRRESEKLLLWSRLQPDTKVGLVATPSRTILVRVVRLPKVLPEELQCFEIDIEYTMVKLCFCVGIWNKQEKGEILFIDEINCVSETLAPAMLQFAEQDLWNP